MNYEALNEVLRNFNNISQNGECVETKTDEENDWEGETKVFKMNEDKFGNDVFIKVYYEESRYTYNDEIVGIEFVQPTKVKITEFKSK